MVDFRCRHFGAMDVLTPQMRVSQSERYLFGDPHHKDSNIFRKARSCGLSFVVMVNIMGSTLGSPYFGKLPNVFSSYSFIIGGRY